MKILSRIERDYVLKTFKEEKPLITLVCNSEIIPITTDAYTIEQNRIYLMSNMPLSEVTVFFTHRDCPLFWYAQARYATNQWYLPLPQLIYKSEQKPALSTPYAKIYLTQKRFLTIRSSPLMQLTTDTPNRPCLASILKKAQHIFTQNQSHLSLLAFVDEQTLCIASIAAITELISLRQNRAISLHFAHRNIHVSQAPTTAVLSDQDSDDPSLSQVTLTCLSIEQSAVEDKRFLYEFAYHHPYNPSL